MKTMRIDCIEWKTEIYEPVSETNESILLRDDMGRSARATLHSDGARHTLLFTVGKSTLEIEFQDLEVTRLVLNGHEYHKTERTAYWVLDGYRRCAQRWQSAHRRLYLCVDVDTKPHEKTYHIALARSLESDVYANPLAVLVLSTDSSVKADD